jgi:hypothetical protein
MRPDVAVDELDGISCRVAEVHRAPAFPVDLPLDLDSRFAKGGDSGFVTSGLEPECEVAGAGGSV